MCVWCIEAIQIGHFVQSVAFLFIKKQIDSPPKYLDLHSWPETYDLALGNLTFKSIHFCLCKPFL